MFLGLVWGPLQGSQGWLLWGLHGGVSSLGAGLPVGGGVRLSWGCCPPKHTPDPHRDLNEINRRHITESVTSIRRVRHPHDTPRSPTPPRNLAPATDPPIPLLTWDPPPASCPPSQNRGPLNLLPQPPQSAFAAWEAPQDLSASSDPSPNPPGPAPYQGWS